MFFKMFKPLKKKLKYSKYDCAIVCGYPANDDGTPSLIMKSRVERAVALYHQGFVDYLIVSGARVQNEYVEADVMAQYAIELGVEKNKIIKESNAKCTYHNLMYGKVLMNEYGLNKCLVVTNSWHLRKANYYALKFELDYAMISALAPNQYSKLKQLYLHLQTNWIMFINVFKGYY